MSNEVEINKVYKCLSNNKLYKVVKIIPYKDENSNGWIESVIYIPLYNCDIPEFSRSMSQFLKKFKLEDY